MSSEIEIKFIINDENAGKLRSFLNDWVISEVTSWSKPTRLPKSMNNLTPGAHLSKNCLLSNTYYDTTKNNLREMGCGLRIRTIGDGLNQKFEMTLKREDRSLAGLHQRFEFNVDLPNNELDVFALPEAALPKQCNRVELQNELIPLFTTDFWRQSWVIFFANSEIEVALDKGKILSNNQSTEIQEVELELKLGTTSDLVKFAIELNQFGLRLCSQSKAARGYQLLNNSSLQFVNFDPIKCQQLPLLLAYWQKSEEYAIQNQDIDVCLETCLNIKNVLMNDPFSFTNEFVNWSHQLEKSTAILDFINSEIHTQLKLMLMLQIEERALIE